ncbi:MAG: hypothetical protein JNL53_20160 [Cyclobacteriaceae bacterium]|nr:hypothetical protein [Cyclobacteriaceae bacterium]
MMYLGGTTGLHMNFANPKVNGAIRFHTGGFDSQASERMVIHYNGNVGIGLSSPTKKLDVNGIIGVNGVSVINTANSPNDIYINGRVIRNESTVNQDGMYINYNSNGGAGAHLRFFANGTTERMQISASTGNVGINTPAHATHRLDVNGSINATALYVNGVPFTGGGGSSQWTNNGSSIYFNTGNLGLGTTTPMGKLDINHAGGQLRLSGGTVVGGVWTSATEHLYLADWNTGTKGLLINMTSGNIGIGTTNLSTNTKLEVVGPATGSGPTIRAGGGGDVVLNSGGSVFFDGNYNYGAGNYIRPVAANTQAFFTSGAERMRIASNGNVGIGTTLAANPNNYKLAVNGLIGAKEVKVENTSTTWPDYVFSSDYKLKPLLELEQYINENKHLPEVPSASDIAVNGQALGEMNVLLLKKVEELTLYIIELKKVVDSLKAEKK